MQDFKLGQHEQAIQSLLEGQARVESRLGRIEEQLNIRAGERKVTMWLFSALSAFVGAATTVLLRTFHLGA